MREARSLLSTKQKKEVLQLPTQQEVKEFLEL